jgi:hypothetical protein
MASGQPRQRKLFLTVTKMVIGVLSASAAFTGSALAAPVASGSPVESTLATQVTEQIDASNYRVTGFFQIVGSWAQFFSPEGDSIKFESNTRPYAGVQARIYDFDLTASFPYSEPGRTESAASDHFQLGFSKQWQKSRLFAAYQKVGGLYSTQETTQYRVLTGRQDLTYENLRLGYSFVVSTRSDFDFQLLDNFYPRSHYRQEAVIGGVGYRRRSLNGSSAIFSKNSYVDVKTKSELTGVNADTLTGSIGYASFLARGVSKLTFSGELYTGVDFQRVAKLSSTTSKLEPVAGTRIFADVGVLIFKEIILGMKGDIDISMSRVDGNQMNESVGQAFLYAQRWF